MKAGRLGLIACAATLTASAAIGAERCVPYGDKKTDFTWLLCPDGEKYERQYQYFGFWSSYYRVSSDTGACNWSPGRSAWLCPDRVLSCTPNRCG